MALADTVFTSALNMSTQFGGFKKTAGGNAWNARCATDTFVMSHGQEIEFTNVTERSIIVGFGLYSSSTTVGNAQFKAGLRVEDVGSSGRMDYIIDGNITAGPTGVLATDVFKISFDSNGIHFYKNGTEFTDSPHSYGGNGTDTNVTANAYSEYTDFTEIQHDENSSSGGGSGGGGSGGGSSSDGSISGDGGSSYAPEYAMKLNIGYIR